MLYTLEQGIGNKNDCPYKAIGLGTGTGTGK